MVFKLASEHMGAAEISRMTGIPRFTVPNIIRNRFYRDQVTIDSELWQRAQKYPKKAEVTEEIMRKYGIQMRLKILKILPASTREVATTLDIDRTTAHKWLTKLKNEKVTYQTGRLDKWLVREEYRKESKET
jgi:predicted HTH transcriptional regulator